jgi:hypothetical protein
MKLFNASLLLNPSSGDSGGGGSSVPTSSPEGSGASDSQTPTASATPKPNFGSNLFQKLKSINLWWFIGGVLALYGVVWATYKIATKHHEDAFVTNAVATPQTNIISAGTTSGSGSGASNLVAKLTEMASLVNSLATNSSGSASNFAGIADALQSIGRQLVEIEETNIIRNASTKKSVAKPASAGSGDNGSVRMNNITVSTTGKKSPATVIGIQNNFQGTNPFKPWRSDLVRSTNKVEITTNNVSTTNPFQWTIDGDGIAIFQVVRNVSFRPMMSMRDRFDVWYGDDRSLAVYDFGADSIPQTPRNEDGSYIFVFQTKPLTPLPAVAKVSITPSRKFL